MRAGVHGDEGNASRRTCQGPRVGLACQGEKPSSRKWRKCWTWVYLPLGPSRIGGLPRGPWRNAGETTRRKRDNHKGERLAHGIKVARRRDANLARLPGAVCLAGTANAERNEQGDARRQPAPSRPCSAGRQPCNGEHLPGERQGGKLARGARLAGYPTRSRWRSGASRSAVPGEDRARPGTKRQRLQRLRGCHVAWYAARQKKTRRHRRVARWHHGARVVPGWRSVVA